MFERCRLLVIGRLGPLFGKLTLEIGGQLLAGGGPGALALELALQGRRSPLRRGQLITQALGAGFRRRQLFADRRGELVGVRRVGLQVGDLQSEPARRFLLDLQIGQRCAENLVLSQKQGEQLVVEATGGGQPLVRADRASGGLAKLLANLHQRRLVVLGELSLPLQVGRECLTALAFDAQVGLKLGDLPALMRELIQNRVRECLRIGKPAIDVVLGLALAVELRGLALQPPPQRDDLLVASG